MIIRLYSMYDSKALTWSPPFLAESDAVACRMVSDIVTDTDTIVGRHPMDFRLYCVGQWDNAKASLRGIEPAEHVVDAIALVPIQSKLPLEEAAQ